MKKAEIISFFGKIEKIKIKESGFEKQNFLKEDSQSLQRTVYNVR